MLEKTNGCQRTVLHTLVFWHGVRVWCHLRWWLLGWTRQRVPLSQYHQQRESKNQLCFPCAPRTSCTVARPASTICPTSWKLPWLA